MQALSVGLATVGLGMYKRLGGTTGEYDPYIADDRVLALGTAWNTHDSRIAQADLSQIAPQIAG
jgi:hypothetical protein